MDKSENPEISLAILLDQTRDIVYRAVDLELAQNRINNSQAKILYMLAKEPEGISLQQLSNWALRNLNTISATVNKMESHGLVKKFKKPDDDKTYIILTEKGSDLFHNKITENSIHLMLGRFSEEEKKQLESLLLKLRSTARDLMGMDYKPPFLP